jgi:predicted outer membrane lipoprotein
MEATANSSITYGRDQDAIDDIIYLASLASEPAAIQPLLDEVRAVTARMQIGATPSEKDRARLQEVRRKLERYLEQRDPLRSLTASELQSKLRAHAHAANQSARGPRSLAIIGGASLAGFLLSLAVLPAGLRPFARVMLSIPAFIVPLHCGIIWLFWSALKGFRAELRQAYAYICLGVIMTVLGAVQFPVLFALPRLFDLPVFRYGGFLPFFTVMCWLFYIGVRRFAHLLQLKGWYTSWKVILPLAAVFAIVVALLPHTANVPASEEKFFDLSVLSFALCAFISLPNALITRAIARNLATRYAPAMHWFSDTQIVIAVGSLVFAVGVFISGPTSGLLVSVIASPFMVSEILLLVSGYIFKRDLTAI